MCLLLLRRPSQSQAEERRGSGGRERAILSEDTSAAAAPVGAKLDKEGPAKVAADGMATVEVDKAEHADGEDQGRDPDSFHIGHSSYEDRHGCRRFIARLSLRMLAMRGGGASLGEAALAAVVNRAPGEASKDIAIAAAARGKVAVSGKARRFKQISNERTTFGKSISRTVVVNFGNMRERIESL